MKTLKELEQEERNRAIDAYRKPFLVALSRKLEEAQQQVIQDTANETVAFLKRTKGFAIFNDLATTPRPTRRSPETD